MPTIGEALTTVSGKRVPHNLLFAEEHNLKKSMHSIVIASRAAWSRRFPYEELKRRGQEKLERILRGLGFTELLFQRRDMTGGICGCELRL